MKTLNWWLLRMAVLIGLPVAMIVVLFGVVFAQVSVPQNAAAASALYKVPESVLFPVANPDGFVVGWKVESSSVLTISTPSGACVDFITSVGSPIGYGSIMHSPIEDWSRWQVTGTSYLVGSVATLYMGTCGSIVEISATVTAVPALNVRLGPGTTYAKIGAITGGTSIIVQARNTDSTWFYAITAVNRGAWLSGAYLDFAGKDTSSLPVIEALSPQNKG